MDAPICPDCQVVHGPHRHANEHQTEAQRDYAQRVLEWTAAVERERKGPFVNTQHAVGAPPFPPMFGEVRWSINEVTPERMPTIVFHDGCDFGTLPLVLSDEDLLVDVYMKDNAVYRGIPRCDGDYLVLKDWEQPTRPTLARLRLDDVRTLVVL
ncbi:MAG: hypothetical protein EPN91_13115 [Salinibacterium sp.]|nr:MAG: hypothetical protein EPN91_13115 [Salinibacterium sp.]